MRWTRSMVRSSPSKGSYHKGRDREWKSVAWLLIRYKTVSIVDILRLIFKGGWKSWRLCVFRYVHKPLPLLSPPLPSFWEDYFLIITPTEPWEALGTKVKSVPVLLSHQWGEREDVRIVNVGPQVEVGQPWENQPLLMTTTAVTIMHCIPYQCT